jgi:hypothetical protein
VAIIKFTHFTHERMICSFLKVLRIVSSAEATAPVAVRPDV